MDGWTEERVRRETGWETFRDGKRLAEAGKVTGLTVAPGVLTARVGGGERPWRVTVRTAGYLEVECPCATNRRSGAVCEHAVAVVLTALGGKSSERSPMAPVAALDKRPVSLPARGAKIHLMPHFLKALGRGRLALTVEWGEPDPAPEARAFWEWLARAADVENPPKHLNLGPGQLPDFLEALRDHPAVYDPEGNLVEIGTAEPLRVSESRLEGHKLLIRLETGGITVMDGLSRLAWATKRRIGFAPWEGSGSMEKAVREALLSGRAVVPLDSADEPLQAWLDLTAAPRPGWLGSLRFEMAEPRVHIVLGGNLATMQACIRVEGPENQREALEAGHILTENPDARLRLLHELRRVGFAQKSGELWELRGHEKIFDFLADELPVWEGRWEVAREPAFAEVARRVHVVRPVVSTPERGSLAVELSFQTGGGAVLASERVLQWIQAGRKQIRTSDGAELVLSRDLTEEWGPLAADLGIGRPEGRIQLDRARAEALRLWAGQPVTPPEIELSLPTGLRLRSYQATGVRWLADRLRQLGAALLADEMGLGKTPQSLLALRVLQHANQCGKALILAPSSLLANWQHECDKFVPGARVLRLHGPGRDALRDREADFVLTSHGTFQRDLAYHLAAGYDAVVLDEASLIRNPKSSLSRDVAKLRAPMKLALTGTPIENRLTDLWAVFRFLAPGYLGAADDFKARYPESDTGATRRLRARIGPYWMRRTKAEVAPDLPDKLENDILLELEPEARKMYQEIAATGLRLAADSPSQAAARMHLLTTLLRLRQVCLDPKLLASDEESLPSSKTEWLRQLLEENLGNPKATDRNESRKILVFSQFATFLRNLEDEIGDAGWEIFRLDGSTRNRGELVKRFQCHEGSAVFLISLKAGGYGLNLTAADTVVLMDPWWNPAVEAQAADRAHRIGQTLPVTVYRLLIQDSVEDRVRARQASKRSLVAGMEGGESGQGWSDQELGDLLR